MVASSDEFASRVGVEILQRGGNAVDAAVAVGLALAVTWPAAGNIGGGGFMLIRKADGTTVTIDYRERAPRKSHRDLFLDQKGNVIPSMSIQGHRAVAVPGTVAGFAIALEKYGKMKWIASENGAFRGWNEKKALEITLTPSLQGGKASWNCKGYPADAMPTNCGGRG